VRCNDAGARVTILLILSGQTQKRLPLGQAFLAPIASQAWWQVNP